MNTKILNSYFNNTLKSSLKYKDDIVFIQYVDSYILENCKGLVKILKKYKSAIIKISQVLMKACQNIKISINIIDTDSISIKIIPYDNIIYI